MMSAEKENSELTVEKVLEAEAAKQAFDTLVRKKVDPELLKYWLREIATAPEKYAKGQESKTDAAQLVRNARSLANKIERARKSPPLLFRGRAMDLPLKPIARLEDELVESLRQYASYWESLMSKPLGRGRVSPRTDRILVLLDIVKRRTGTCHYREIADLLNAMDKAYRSGTKGTIWDITNLGELQYHSKNRMKKLLAG